MTMTKKILDRILALLAEEPAGMLPAKIGALRAAIEIISADASSPARNLHVQGLSAEEAARAFREKPRGGA